MAEATPIPDVAREARECLQRLYGRRLRDVILYGSHARGDAALGSDIDLLVVLDDFPDAAAELARMDPTGSELSLRHDVVIAFIPVRARDYAERNSPLLINVRREGIVV